MATCGLQPSSRAAFETSAQVVGTSAGWAGRYSICGFLPSQLGNLLDDRVEHHHAVAAQVDHFVAQRPQGGDGAARRCRRRR